jgi:hypothetical protein
VRDGTVLRDRLNDLAALIAITVPTGCRPVDIRLSH